jgi:glycosyltransferase involved in cell wall biosynthesis
MPRLFGGDIHRRKLLRQLWFYLVAAPTLLLRRRPGVYVVQTNPPLLVPIAAAVAGLRRVPLVIIAQDVYPEVMFAHGMARPDRLAGRLLSRLFAWAYGKAAKVVALGDTMAERLVHKGVDPRRIERISNWATGDESIVRDELNPLRRDWDLSGCFVILYSGNIGIAHDVETPIRALRLLIDRIPHVRLVFVGKGSRLDEAQRLVASQGLQHAVQFRALVPPERLPHSLGVADIALVSLRVGFEGLVVPSKLLGYMARGIPTLYVGSPGDVQSMLLASGGGLSLRNEDAAGVARALESLINDPTRLQNMGKAARDHYERELSRPRGLDKYARLISSVVPCTSAAPVQSAARE